MLARDASERKTSFCWDSSSRDVLGDVGVIYQQYIQGDGTLYHPRLKPSRRCVC